MRRRLFRSLEGRLRLVVGVLCALSVLQILYLSGLWVTGRYVPTLVDFGAYWNAGVRARLGYPLYVKSSTIPALEELPHASWAYLYPPVVVLVFIPFSFLPITTAKVAWTLISGITFLVGVYSLLKSYTGLEKQQSVLLSIAALGFAPFLGAIYLGQVTPIFVGLLCLGASINYRQGGPALRSLLVLLPGLVKPMYLPGNAQSLLDARQLLVKAGGVLTFVILSVSIFGVGPHIEYVGVLMEGKGWGANPDPVANWVNGKFDPFYAIHEYRLAAQAIVILITIVTALGGRIQDREGNLDYVFVLGLLTIPLATPKPNQIILLVALPAMIILTVLEYRRQSELATICLASIGLIHLNGDLIELVVTFTPSPIEGAVFTVLPVLQPALIALLIAYTVTICRIWGVSPDIRTMLTTKHRRNWGH